MPTLYESSAIDSLRTIKEKINSIQQRAEKRYDLYNVACKTSKTELIRDLKNLIKSLRESKNEDIPIEIITLGGDILGATTWVSLQYLEYLKSFVQFSIDSQIIQDERSQEILFAVKNHTPIEQTDFKPAEIFQCLFKEFKLKTENEHYNSNLSYPKTNTRIILIPGVLNEVYRTAAFEQGAINLQKRLGITYCAINVHGRRGSTYNSKLIKEQLEKNIVQNPNTKLWILSHSKGGIDALHFLKHNHDFASKHIAGLSTIASPLTGSNHTNHQLVKFLQLISKLEHNSLYQKFDRGQDFLLKNVPHYLSENYQKQWLDRYHDHLPKNIFYSSLGLKSPWHKTHIWMLFAKFLFRNSKVNDGIVDIDQAHFPSWFEHINLGYIDGHHLIGARSSRFNQEALLIAHISTIQYLKQLI